MQHINMILNAFNSIQLLLQSLDVEFSAVSPVMSTEAWLLCQAQLERFAWQCCNCWTVMGVTWVFSCIMR